MNNLLSQAGITPDQGSGGFNAGSGDTSTGSFTNPFLKGSALEGMTGENFISQFIPRLIGLLFVVGGISFFFMFIWGAISWILSGGDKAHVEAAKGRITNALIGFVLMISVFAVVAIIENFFDINILSIDIGPLAIQ